MLSNHVTSGSSGSTKRSAYASNEPGIGNCVAISPSDCIMQYTARPMVAYANIAPPGHYMVFILNGSDVPSTARIMRIF